LIAENTLPDHAISVFMPRALGLFASGKSQQSLNFLHNSNSNKPPCVVKGNPARELWRLTKKFGRQDKSSAKLYAKHCFSCVIWMIGFGIGGGHQ